MLAAGGRCVSSEALGSHCSVHVTGFPSHAPLHHSVACCPLLAANRSGKLQNRSRCIRNEDGGLHCPCVRLWLRNARRDLLARSVVAGRPRSSHSDFGKPWLCRYRSQPRPRLHQHGLMVSFAVERATVLPVLQEWHADRRTGSCPEWTQGRLEVGLGRSRLLLHDSAKWIRIYDSPAAIFHVTRFVCFVWRQTSRGYGVLFRWFYRPPHGNCNCLW